LDKKKLSKDQPLDSHTHTHTLTAIYNRNSLEIF